MMRFQKDFSAEIAQCQISLKNDISVGKLKKSQIRVCMETPTLLDFANQSEIFCEGSPERKIHLLAGFKPLKIKSF